MDLIETHAARLPAIGDRWVPATYSRAELLAGLRAGGIACPEVSHPMDNVLRNIGLMCEGDPDKQFGLTGLRSRSPWEVLQLVGRAAGFTPDRAWTQGPVPIDPGLVVDACEAVGDRLAFACRRRERVILATGHPVGLAHLYMEVGRQLRARGVQLLRPYEGIGWQEPRSRDTFEVRYLEGMAMLTDGSSARHTHSAEPMRRMLRAATPDIVFADHGFAGAAIEAGVETVSIADVNDPALLVAQAQGRTEHVIVMDDHVQPEDYWPCFQAIAARLP
jgi:hypothetical protein